MNRSKKMTVLAASLVLGLGGAALAAGTDTMGTGMNSSMSGGMSSGMVDYSLLNNPNFDYVQLKQARARGLNEDEVATVAKIAEKTGVPFRDIVDKVLEGQTFASMADDYNMKLSDVLDVTDEKAKIASYEATYETTGKWAMKNMDMSGGSTMGTMPGTPAMGTGADTMGTTTTTAPN